MQTLHIQVGQVTATVLYWQATPASTTLLYWSHGMQGAEAAEPIVNGVVPIPPRNYAFTVPYDTSLNNLTFTEDIDRLCKFVDVFKTNAVQFAWRIPRLYIYPFIFGGGAIVETLEKVAAKNSCDVMHLTELTSATGQADYITLESLLRATFPGQGAISDKYDSFLLLACRSKTPPRTIGFGGAPPAYSEGLYKVEPGEVHITVAKTQPKEEEKKGGTQ